MRVFCSGFNLYGQFLNCNDVTLKTFIDWQYDESTSLELSHTFLITWDTNEIILYGAKKGETHKIQKLLCNTKILDIACAENRVLFLNNNFELYKINIKDDNEITPVILQNKRFEEEQKEKIIKISCGNKINVAVTQCGKVYNLPNELDFKNDNIIDISCGCEHCLILDSKGCVYSFGRGSRGQLGHGNLEDELESKQIIALAGIKIIKIAAGGWHSCALSIEGDLYIWGWNGNGQLGLQDNKNKVISVMATPHVVDFEESLDISAVNVACGYRHTVVLLDNKKLYGSGWNKYNQLGIINLKDENVYTMTFLYDFSNLEINDLKCGPWSTAVLVT